MIRILTLSLCVFLMHSCGLFSRGGHSSAFDELYNTEKDFPYKRDDDFADNPFDFDVSVENIRKQYGHLFSMKTKVIPNRHWEEQKDTLFIFSKGKTEIVIHRAAGKDMLESAFITTPKITLRKGVQVGMKKEDFLKSFRFEETGDTLQVGNEERGKVLTFLFSRNKLKNIALLAYVD